MKKKYSMIVFFFLGIFILFPPLPNQMSLVSVFRVTEDPAVILRGTSNSALTVNISFGDSEVVEWLHKLKSPYPLLFVDMEWASRFPETVELIKEKNIPVALLGHDGNSYEKNISLFIGQIERFEMLFGSKPLWFRTLDERFPYSLQTVLWDTEVNALGSSITWLGGEPPTFSEGEIISVPHHRTQRVNFAEMERLNDGRTFASVEDVLFGTTTKFKKIPN